MSFSPQQFYESVPGLRDEGGNKGIVKCCCNESYNENIKNLFFILHMLLFQKKSTSVCPVLEQTLQIFPHNFGKPRDEES